MSMIEITYSNSSADIMVDRDVETGAILDIYTYVNDLPRINIPGTWNWKVGDNPLFTHLVDKIVPFYTQLCDMDNGFYNLDGE